MIQLANLLTKHKVAIAGAAGYTGGELLRLLVNHPAVELVLASSRSQAGKPVHSAHADLLGETELHFSADIDMEVDVLFLCLGHGESRAWLQQHPQPASTLVIDLSNDFRLNGAEGFIYGLPEVNGAAVVGQKRIANPGCFATAIQLALLPLAQAGLLSQPVHINATTGSTGAGVSLSATSHFSWRAANLSVYKAFNHQHLAEIQQTLGAAQGDNASELHFIPQRGAFARGILAACVTQVKKEAGQIKELYEWFASQHRFVFFSDSLPDLKQVVNTNKCVLGIEQQGNQLLIVSVIDNLLKGASGQAVQNMNLALGLAEDTGLRLKAIGF